MKAVFKHELSSHFSGLSGFVFGAFLLFFAGIYCMVYNLKNCVTNFEYVFGGMSFVFLIIVPIITMRILADEKRQRTDQLLYSLPITMTDVVVGKYAALLVLFVIPLAIIGIYPLVLKQYGNISLLTSYGSLVGFFFLGAALIAIGMFISSITESQAVAAGICFLVMLLNYYMSSLASFVSTSAFATFFAIAILIIVAALLVLLMTKSRYAAGITTVLLGAGLLLYYNFHASSMENILPDLVENLSLFSKFYVFVNGVFDLRSIMYYLTVIVIFLFLSVESLERRRWSE